MREHTRVLRNMSSSSRSYADVVPRRFDPPSTTAHGKRLVRDVGVAIGLPFNFNYDSSSDEADMLAFLCSRLAPKERVRTVVEHENLLRALAESVVKRVGLVGCMIMKRGTQAEETIALRNPVLAFAILAKSSDTLFVAAKTPNLTPELLARMLITFDPRLAALAEGGKL